MLLIGLLVLAAVVVWRIFASRSRSAANSPRAGGLAFQGAGSPADATAPPQYSPRNVGNDASARPWESNAAAFDASASQPEHAIDRPVGSSMAGAAAAGGSMIGSALAGSQTWGIPAGFDADGFLAAAKRNFVTLQDAWDRADIGTLRSMMTDGMVGEIRQQLAERETHTGGQPNKTEVVMLDAKLLGIEELPDAYLASVEFSGMIREDVSSGPSPFREVWNMTKDTKGGSGWLVAGVQALQLAIGFVRGVEGLGKYCDQQLPDRMMQRSRFETQVSNMTSETSRPRRTPQDPGAIWRQSRCAWQAGIGVDATTWERSRPTGGRLRPWASATPRPGSCR